MAYINLPLAADGAYDYTINLGKSSFRFVFELNTRQNLYHFSIYDKNENPLFLGVALLPMAYENIKLPEADGVLVLLPQNSSIQFDQVPATSLLEKYSFIFFPSED